jgi:uncharacterized protein (TIGR03437 family)
MNPRLGLLIPLIFSATSFAQIAPQYIVRTVAGTMPVGDGGPATAALLERPYAVGSDATGNVYIADFGHSAIRKVSTSGVITSVSGVGYYAYDLKVDASNNLYLATATQVIKATPAGVISVVAGTTSSGFGGDGAKATAANFNMIRGIAVDAAGNLYIADSNNHRVRKVDTEGIVRTIVGVGTAGFNGDNLPGTGTQLNSPRSVAVDAAGNVFISDNYNYRLRMLEATSGIIRPYAGNGYCCSSGDGGAANLARLSPGALHMDSAGNLLVVDQWTYTVRTISPGGTIRTVVGSGQYGVPEEGPALSAKFASITGIATDRGGNIYVVDYNNDRVSVVQAGAIRTLAGASHFRGDGGSAPDALLHRPQNAVVATDGTIYIADTYNHRIRKVAPNGTITTVAGDGQAAVRGDDGDATKASIAFPYDMALDANGNLYFVDDSSYRVRRLTPQGIISAVAGNGNYDFSPDGARAVQSAFKFINGLAVDGSGNIYISDSGNHRVRKISPDGILSTVAGTGTIGFGGDGGLATSAQLAFPDALALDKSGNLYIYDWNNYRVRKVTPSGIISTVAGNGSCCYTGDGGAATDARISLTDIAVDGAGNIWMINGIGLRVLDGSGKISTVAGSSSYGFAGDGQPAGTATRMDAMGVAVGANGDVILVDTYNNRIRKLEPNPAARLDIVSGNNQDVTVNEASKAAVIVRLIGKTGTGLSGAPVAFAVTAGEARLSAATATTDGTGQAGISFTPTKAGALTIAATSNGFNVNFNFTVKTAAVVTPPTPTVPLPRIAAGGIVQNGYSTPAIQAVSSGAIVSIFGSNFDADGAKPVSGILENGRMQTKVSGVCVLFGTAEAYVLGVSPSQLTVQVPVVTPGTVAVRVLRNCGAADELRGDPVNVTAQPATPELLYLRNNTDGKNPVAAANPSGGWFGATDAVPGLRLTPAKAGDVLVLYALGLGATGPASEPGTPAVGIAQVTGDFQISIGGVPAGKEDILYAGVSPGFLGLYQINLRVPAGVNSGNQPVVVRVGNISSPAGPYLGIAQ